MLSPFLPRGIRNHNPGNLRLSPQPWQGEQPGADDAFCCFVKPLWGLRALMRTLLTYHLKYGLDTVESIINRYAPPHENATDRYISVVAKRLGVKRRDGLDLSKKPALIALARAIVAHENGRAPAERPKDWYDDALYEEAARLSFLNA